MQGISRKRTYSTSRLVQKRSIAIATGVSVSVALAACSSPSSSDGASTSTIIAGNAQDFAGFDPLTNQAFTIDYLRPVYDSLILRKGADDFEPGIATEWDYNPDELTMTLTIREGVKFTDGTPLDAEAVKANLERGMTMDSGPWSTFFNDLRSVETNGDNTIVINLKEPSPAILANLSFAPGMIVSPKSLQDPEELRNNPVGTGPWTLDADSVEAGDTYVFEKNPDYWDPEVQRMDTYVMKVVPDPKAASNALRSGQLDLVQTSAQQAVQLEKAGFEVHSSSQLAYFVDIADRKGEVVPALGDVRVRRAIGLALDRATLLEATYGGYGEPISTVFEKGKLGYSPDVADELDFNVKKAKFLMEEAGYGDGFAVDVYVTSFNGNIANAVAGMLADIGITMNVTVVPDAGTFAAKVEQRQSPIMVVASGLRSPWEIYTGFASEGGRYNPFKVTTSDVEAAANKVAELSDLDGNKANSAYADLFEALLWDDAVITPAFTGQTPVATTAEVHAEWNTEAQALPDPRNLYKEEE